MDVNDQKCWVAKTGKDLADEVWLRWKAHVTYMRSSGRYDAIVDSHAMRLGLGRLGTGRWTARRIARSGVKGEMLRIRVNHYGSIGREVVTLATAQMPTGEPRAINTDTKSITQTEIASDLVKYHMDEGLAEQLKTNVDDAVHLAEAWLGLGWDALAGEVIPFEQRTPEEQQQDARFDEATGDLGEPLPRHDGAPDIFTLTPLDVARDLGRTDPENEWLIFRRPMSRHRLASKFPERAEEIYGFGPPTEEGLFRLDPYRTLETWSDGTTDIVYMLTMHHLPLPGIPGLEQGKRLVMLSADIILEEGPLPFSDIGLYQLYPSLERDTPFGATSLWDLQAPQDGFNMSASMALTKGRLGTPKVLAHENSGVGAAELSGDNTLVKWSGTEQYHKPEMLAATVTSEPDLALAGFLQAQMETTSGINSVARGNVSALGADASGALAAFIQAQAIVANSDLQANFHRHVGTVLTALVARYRDFAGPRSRTIEVIAGEATAARARAFSADDLSAIARVHVGPANPLTHSTQSRMRLLALMREFGVQLPPDKILEFALSGQWKTTVEDEANELSGIREEVENLRRGIPTPVLPYDNHPRRIQAIYRGVFNDREARLNPAIYTTAIQQVQKHQEAWMMADPGVLAVLGIPSFGAAMQAAGVIPPPGPAPSGGAGGATAKPPREPGPESQQPNMPSMPRGPDGQPVDPYNTSPNLS